jgi:5-methylcytosine-specific restriction endonuclease McrBC GTP-binding regulatory subunit McrB
MLKFTSIPAMIDECFEYSISGQPNWYERYKTTHQKIMVGPESEEVLELLWYARNNAVSSLMQGNTSKKEFEDAKARLSSLTAQIVKQPTAETYELAVEELKNLKSEGIFRYFYGSLLNRVFAAIAPSEVTSSVKELAFMQAANFINDNFKLGLSLQGNWFQKNVELKHALRQKLPNDYDDFKINIAVWNLYEVLEEEKKQLSPQDEQPETKGRNHFILQGNPKKFNIDEYLSSNIDIFWTASRFANDMSIGDIVYIWRSGQNAGAIARGTITVLPQTIKQLKESEYLGEDLWRENSEPEETKNVGIQLETFRLTEDAGMLGRKELKQDGTLKNALIIKSPQGSVFKLSKNEAHRLDELWNAKQILEDKFAASEIQRSSLIQINLTVEQYKEALRADTVVNDNSLLLLSALFHSPNSEATSPQLATTLGVNHFGGVNATIGKLGKRIAHYFNINKHANNEERVSWWPMVANGRNTSHGFMWQLNDNLKTALIELDMIQTIEGLEVKEKKQGYSSNSPLNQILYGPPGTGKTYHTIEAAVHAAQPDFNYDTRETLKAKYDELVDQKRIQFVTFHQSYGYEEFVEGLRAVTEEGQVSYEIQSGIFKRICTLATTNMIKSQRTSAVSFDACWEVFLNQFDDDEGTKVKTKKSWFIITEITETTIHFEKAQGSSKHSLAIKTLKQVFNGTKVIKGGLNVYYQPLVEHLKALSANIQSSNEPIKNFVLVIDEINRGNISKIFGELITLIEESKRTFGDNNESIEVTLPYSADQLSVPSNLHLIGTMNTADRSLAMMDTALRRRFDFVEMMPDYSVLAGLNVKGIALDILLQKMNARIEALYDREHTLGHAFLIPVKIALLSNGEESAFNLLKATFINKFIPLLEEYFFDDWNKIRLVLGDNQKPEALQFVKKISHSYAELFGAEHGLETFVEEAQSFDLASPDDDIWKKPEAYIGIFSVLTEY